MNFKLDADISRRRFLVSTSMAATVALLAPRHMFAQDEGLVQTARKTAAAATITVQQLRGKISVLMGAGGNIAVLPGRDGKVLIDAGYAGARPKITAALASISSDPIKHLINTHWHFDHTDGNEWLHSAGATILSHTNTRKHLSTATRVEGWNFTFPPSPPGAIPAEVFDDERTVELNGMTIALKHYAPAHTDGDISVHFTSADIFHVGDTFWNGYYPFIDYSTGGSIDGMIRATEANLAKVTDSMIVIPGHGAVGDKSQLAFYHNSPGWRSRESSGSGLLMEGDYTSLRLLFAQNQSWQPTDHCAHWPTAPFQKPLETRLSKPLISQLSSPIEFAFQNHLDC